MTARIGRSRTVILLAAFALPGIGLTGARGLVHTANGIDRRREAASPLPPPSFLG